MPKLKHIDLSNNKITAVNFSVQNQSIIELNLSNNPLKRVNSIQNLTALRKLSLINCPVEDWEVLTLLPNLKQLYIFREKSEIVTHLQNLLPNCEIIC